MLLLCWVCFSCHVLKQLLLSLYFGSVQAHHCHGPRRIAGSHNREPRAHADAGESMGCRVAQGNLGAVYALRDIPHLQLPTSS